MKKILGIITMGIFMCSCGGPADNKSVEVVKTDSVQIDSLAFYMQKLDSLNNSGKLTHLDLYKLGKMKSIEFQVIRISSETDTVEYINLRKDCGGDYYYDWENATLLAEEVKYFVNAIDTIADNFERPVTNEERYAYITKDDIRLFSINETPGSGKWSADLSVDYHKNNSHININKEDFVILKDLLVKGEKKIKELRKK